MADVVDSDYGDDREAKAPDSGMGEGKLSWGKLPRFDSFNMESGKVSTHHEAHGRSSSKPSWGRILSLAFQSVGIIYGDIGTSPLYVFSSTFSEGRIDHNEDIIGVLSLIIYTIVLIPFLKYVFLVLRANDHGDGGTFALYSLICRYAKISLIPKDQPEDRELSNYRLDTDTHRLRRSEKIKENLEKSMVAKVVLFLVTILGTSMVIGDGILTPCISVLSAVGGIEGLGQDAIVFISIGILIALFCVQRFGTDKVGFTFAPAICLWFLFIGGIGVYNLFKHDLGVLKAFNPQYIVKYFQRNGRKGFISLGGVVLCITGAEAMFADLGHFNVPAIQISFSGIALPSLLTAYAGQAAYLTKYPQHVNKTFYKSIPRPLYWPTFVVANVAAVIASQAMISGAFSIIAQSLSLSCFPRVKVVYTSVKYHGQVYIPEINYFLMVACVIVTYGFRTTDKIGNAYGIAVVSVMLITTSLVTLIMLLIWKTSMLWILAFFVVFISIEGVYLSAVLYKFTQGGYLPLAFSLVLMIIMAVWHYAQKQRYLFEMRNKVSSSYVKGLARNPDVQRIPGMGLLYSELVQGIPPIFPHFVSNVPSIHSVVVLVSIKNIPISTVLLEERFLFRQVEPREFNVYRCVVRYGYKDEIPEPHEFERELADNLKRFAREEHIILESSRDAPEHGNLPNSGFLGNGNAVRAAASSVVHVVDATPEQQADGPRVSSGSIHSGISSDRRNLLQGQTQGGEQAVRVIEKAMNQGVFYLIGEAEVVARKESSAVKKFAINYLYCFLRKNFRDGGKTLAIPRTRLLKVGMVYEI